MLQCLMIWKPKVVVALIHFGNARASCLQLTVLCNVHGCVQAGAQLSLYSMPAQPQLAEMQLQLGAARKEVAQLQANQWQPEDACGGLAAERAQAAALRAEDQRIARSHRELQEAW
jgi:hypothetical protein